MNTEQLIVSMTRYVELYYDVKLDETDSKFNDEIKRLFQSNDDSTLEEYWEEYSKARNTLVDGNDSETANKEEKELSLKERLLLAERKRQLENQQNSHSTEVIYDGELVKENNAGARQDENIEIFYKGQKFN